MRIRALWLYVPISLLLAAPAAAAKHPPRPFVASHGVKVKAGYIGQCPRGDRNCAIPDFFATTEPVPVRAGDVLRVNTRRHVRRIRLRLNCAHRRLQSFGNRRWTFEILGDRCANGELNVIYKRIVATYTFNLRRYEPCSPDDSETVAENELVRVYSHPVPPLDDPDPSYPGDGFVACRFDSGRELTIGRDQCLDAYYGCDFLEHVALADEKVAYVTGGESNRYGPDRFSSLRVLDTATWQPSEVTHYNEAETGTRKRVTAVVLKPNGSVAWILYQEDPYYSPTVEVWKADGSGTGLLDSDPEIDPTFLSLDGSTLTWRRGQETRSATLN